MAPKKGKKGKKDSSKEQRQAEERARRERELQEQRNRELLEQYFEKEQSRLDEEKIEIDRILSTKAGELAIVLGNIQKESELKADGYMLMFYMQWAKFMQCDILPSPKSEREVNTYLGLWAEEAIHVEEEPSLTPLFNQLPNAESLEFERANAQDHRADKEWSRLHDHMNRLLEILGTKWDSISQQILQHADFFEREPNENFQLTGSTDGYAFGIWGNLTKNPSLPKPLILSNVAIRMIYMSGVNCGIPYELQEGDGHRSFVGGILLFELSEMPDPPKHVDTWTVRQSTLKRLEYPFKKTATEVAEEEADGTSDALMWSTAVSFPIPSSVHLDPDTVKVMYWNAEFKIWDDEGITDDDIDLENGRVKFRTTHFAPTAVVQNTYAELPYKDWTLEPTDLNRAVLRIYGKRNELHLDIREGECQVLQTTTEHVPKALRGKWLPPSLLLKTPWKSLLFDVNYPVKDQIQSVGSILSDNNVTEDTKFRVDGPEAGQIGASCYHLLRPAIKSHETSAKVEKCSAHFTKTVSQVLAATRVLCFS
eukprot:jgi/Hompol1/6818/HPOL_003796-RA